MRRLIDAAEIQEQVAALGKQITEDYRGHSLTLLGVLTGSIVLLADLIRQIEIPLRLGLLQTSSYRGRSTRPGELSVNVELLPDITDRDVLLVDDIFDTGRTLAGLMNLVQKHRPRSLRSLVLLCKQDRREVEIQPDYVGFQIPDEFVVGYGLDYNEAYRNLPEIAALDAEDL